MLLTEKNINELKHIYKEELNIKLSDEQAFEAWHKMVNLIKNILPYNYIVWKK